jgi:hypothetical protein
VIDLASVDEFVDAAGRDAQVRGSVLDRHQQRTFTRDGGGQSVPRLDGDDFRLHRSSLPLPEESIRLVQFRADLLHRMVLVFCETLRSAICTWVMRIR